MSKEQLIQWVWASGPTLAVRKHMLEEVPSYSSVVWDAPHLNEGLLATALRTTPPNLAKSVHDLCYEYKRAPKVDPDILLSEEVSSEARATLLGALFGSSFTRNLINHPQVREHIRCNPGSKAVNELMLHGAIFFEEFVRGDRFAYLKQMEFASAMQLLSYMDVRKTPSTRVKELLLNPPEAWKPGMKDVSSLAREAVSWIVTDRPSLAGVVAGIPGLTGAVRNTPHWKAGWSKYFPDFLPDFAGLSPAATEGTPKLVLALIWQPQTPLSMVRKLQALALKQDADPTDKNDWSPALAAASFRLENKIESYDIKAVSDPYLLGRMLNRVTKRLQIVRIWEAIGLYANLDKQEIARLKPGRTATLAGLQLPSISSGILRAPGGWAQKVTGLRIWETSRSDYIRPVPTVQHGAVFLGYPQAPTSAVVAAVELLTAEIQARQLSVAAESRLWHLFFETGAQHDLFSDGGKEPGVRNSLAVRSC